jgi:hypothetical protein
VSCLRSFRPCWRGLSAREVPLCDGCATGTASFMQRRTPVESGEGTAVGALGVEGGRNARPE